jgi:hypothetical protein
VYFLFICFRGNFALNLRITTQFEKTTVVFDKLFWDVLFMDAL